MLTTAMKRLPARWSSTTLPSTPVGSTWSRSRSACCAASASTAESTTQTGSAAKSTPGHDNETPPAPASNGCSQPTKPAPKWAAPIPSHPKSHNHCDEVLVTNSFFVIGLGPLLFLTMIAQDPLNPRLIPTEPMKGTRP